MNCAPVQCCCKGPWSIAPGETQPLLLDWSRWLRSLPDYTMNAIASASLIDITANPNVPADPARIRVVSGIPGAPDPEDNGEVKDAIKLMPNFGMTQIMIEASPTARAGEQYRLNIALTARDCDGRRATMRDCVSVVIDECF